MESISLLINIDSVLFYYFKSYVSSIFYLLKKIEIAEPMCEKKNSADALYTSTVSGLGEEVRK